MNPKVISETPIDLGELKLEVEKIKKRDAELNVRMGKTEEYLNSFMPLAPAKAKELYEKLVALNIPRMKDSYCHKIVDVLPENLNVMKAVLRSYPITVSNDNVKKMFELVEEYAQKA